MNELVVVLVGAALANNVVLTKFLGLCPFFGASARVESALGMSLATTFVLTLSAGLGAWVDLALLSPLGLGHLRLLALILVIAVVVQASELVMRASSPVLYRVLGIFLPLITTNCAVLSVALLSVERGRGVLTSAYWGLCTALGFSLVLLLFAAMRERLQHTAVPTLFQGAPIALVSAGLMALALLGFSGVVSE